MLDPATTRPRFSPDYGVPTSAEGMLSWSHVEQRLVAARNYWVSTIRPDGRPHSAPVWGLWWERTFLFSTDPDSRKARNLAARPEVAVHLESGDDVVMLEGQAERLSDPALLAAIVDSYDTKYGYQMDFTLPQFGVYRVRPRVVYAWLERDFPATATRWVFD